MSILLPQSKVLWNMLLGSKSKWENDHGGVYYTIGDDPKP